MRHDLWFALRRIVRRPWRSAMVALTLGLGIGASLAIFAVVDAVLLRPLPYPDAGRLVQLTTIVPSPGFPEQNWSDVGYRTLRERARSLSGVAAWTMRFRNLVEPSSSRRLIVAQVSASLFDVLQVTPRVGRAFTADEDLPNRERVLVLTDQLWRSAYQADPAIIGRSANLEGVPYTIIGVLPPEVTFPSRQVAAFEPLALDPAAQNPFNRRFTLIARLGDLADAAVAERELTDLVREVGRTYPGPHPGSALDEAGYSARVRPLADVVVGDTRPVVLLLLAGVVMLLLLTCANVANLQLASIIARPAELAVRTALGATRRRLVRSALFEGLVLALAGAAAGLVAAASGARLLAVLLPPAAASTGALAGVRLVVAAAVVVVVVGALIGVLPVAFVTRGDAARHLGDRGAAGPHANRLRRILAGTQVALAVTLAYDAGLLIASVRATQRVDLGFRPDSTLTLRINLPAATLADRVARERLLRGLLEDVRQLPGVTTTALVNALPLEPNRRDIAMAVEGRPFRADGTDPLADYRVVSADYFAALGIPLRRGTLFTDDDANPANTPLVISEALARRIFPDGEDPIGRRLRFGPFAPWMPIVAVVGDARNRSLTETPRPELYVPGLGSSASMAFATEITLVVRSRGDAMALLAPVRRIITAAGSDIAIYNIASMEAVVAEAGARLATAMRLMAGYAAVALLLAMAGTYAVLALLVFQRRRELAVRMALGATPRTVVGLVGRESGTVLVAGGLAGLAGAVVSARLLANVLYGVATLDAGILAAVVAVTAAAGVLAALLPALSAARLAPALVLRDGE